MPSYEVPNNGFVGAEGITVDGFLGESGVFVGPLACDGCSEGDGCEEYIVKHIKEKTKHGSEG